MISAPGTSGSPVGGAVAADVGSGVGCVREGTLVQFRGKQTEVAGFLL